ncbi:RING-H2 finger protein ATL56-like [Neltuma alba]|uniref:RING-H2 finger protein ATL56-like n=1 Tax=Neltuma alba TaxID=207710 RepID=UPI0010A3E82A|nr:RING-H2 finger protein ATL56-like [Prosopis alba]
MKEIFISLILLFVGIAALVLIHVCVVGRALRRGSHQGGNEEQSDGDFDGIGTKRMSSEEMKDLPCFEYKEAEKGKGVSSSTVSVDCAVCLESFKDGDICRFLPNCSHSFHVSCIDSWILKTPICPICRTWLHSPLVPKLDVSQNGVIEIV